MSMRFSKNLLKILRSFENRAPGQSKRHFAYLGRSFHCTD